MNSPETQAHGEGASAPIVRKGCEDHESAAVLALDKALKVVLGWRCDSLAGLECCHWSCWRPLETDRPAG